MQEANEKKGPVVLNYVGNNMVRKETAPLTFNHGNGNTPPPNKGKYHGKVYKNNYKQPTSKLIPKGNNTPIIPVKKTSTIPIIKKVKVANEVNVQSQSKPLITEQSKPTITPTPTPVTVDVEPIVTQEPVVETKALSTMVISPIINTPEHPSVVTKFYDTEGNYKVLGASVRGSSHFNSNDPCQDYSKYKFIKDKWGVAVTADGAGSCKLSHRGSRANCMKATRILEEQILAKGWIDNNYIPTELEWFMLVQYTLNRIYNESVIYANKHKLDVTQLSATIIINVHTHFGLLVAHVGDGRAGYLNGKNQWLASITPHKGEESNQTVFLHSNAHTKPDFKMSGVFVPETKIIVDDVKAFVSMSDGCEKATWICSVFENNMFEDPNKPHQPFFNGLVNYLKSDDEDVNHLEDFVDIIKEGNDAFVKETDDKTILLAYL